MNKKIIKDRKKRGKRERVVKHLREEENKVDNERQDVMTGECNPILYLAWEISAPEPRNI